LLARLDKASITTAVEIERPIEAVSGLISVDFMGINIIRAWEKCAIEIIQRKILFRHKAGAAKKQGP
jgi:hypothetical protein